MKRSEASLTKQEDDLVNETTSLLDSNKRDSTSTLGDSSETLSDSTERHMRFLDEMDRPWPATFERSISLLAGPTMDTTFIDQVTKSPKVTPNLPMRAQVMKIGYLAIIFFIFVNESSHSLSFVRLFV